jgi:hypothetical protein
MTGTDRNSNNDLRSGFVSEQIETKAPIWKAFCSNAGVKDSLFLSLVILLSLILYIHQLGFYDDDWNNLREFSLTQHQSLMGLVQGFHHSITAAQTPPIQLLYHSVLYWLFGIRPFGYHIVNAAILMIGILLLYSLLRELNLNRLFALTIPMVYGLLPHYSTSRFWFAAFGGNLSMTLYFLSFLCDLRMLKARTNNLWIWKLTSLLSLLASTLTFDVFLPLFFLNPLIVLHHKKSLDDAGLASWKSQKKLVLLLAINLVTLLLVVVVKGLASSGSSQAPSPILTDQLKYLVEGSISINLRRYGTGLPGVVMKIVREYPDALVFSLGGMLGLIIFGYLYYVAYKSRIEISRSSNALKLLVLGVVVIGLGYAFFLGGARYRFTPTGPDNRTAIAATLGVALSSVAGIALLSSFLRSQQLRRVAFCILTAVLCTSAVLIINTIASFWTGAYRQQREILADIRHHVPSLPAGGTLLVDGICPYYGPAAVFHSQRDLKGALAVAYGCKNLEAAVITPSLMIEEDGITIFLHDEFQRYPYRRLFVYHYGRKMTVQLENAAAARRYFEQFDPDYSDRCPKASVGEGVIIF